MNIMITLLRKKMAYMALMVLFSSTTIKASKVFSQSFENVYVNLMLENKKVTDFFDEIEQQTKFTFVYSGKVAALQKKTTIKKQRISIKETLDILSTRNRFEYMISGTTISVKVGQPTPNKGYTTTTVPLQQTIKGLVTDIDGRPLPGVNVIVKNTDRGVITDFDGQYEIKASSGEILVFSFLGFLDQEMSIGNQTTLNVEMLESISDLEQVIIIGYGTSTKQKLSTAIATISATEAVLDKPFTNLEQSLNGKLAGVQVIEGSGSPGSSVSLRIRGFNSISAGNDPLYIIDGVQSLNTEGLNPSDIESISILKDASATSIYGARASNGVVMIQTKRGKEGKTSFNFATFYGQDRIIETLPLLNSQQYMNYVNTARVNAGQSLVTDPFNQQFNTDWQKELYDPATVQNYQLSVTNGNENGSYFLSAGYQSEEGTIETTQFERFSLRFNLDQQLFDNFKVGSSIGLTRTNFDVINDNARVNQGGVVLSALQTPSILPVQNEDGTFPQNPFQTLDNPIALVRGEERKFETTKALVNVYGEYKFFGGLTFKSSFSIDYGNSKFSQFTDPFTTENGRANGGISQSESFLETIWLWENTLNFKKSIIDDTVDLDFLFGTAAQQSRFENPNMIGTRFATDLITTASGAAEPQLIEEGVDEWANSSLFFRAKIDYLDKYLFSSSVRADGSSRFSPDNRYGIFSSLSAAWLVSKENFLQNVSWLNTFKIRYSYGTTGNQFISNYDWYGLYGIRFDYVQGGNETVVPGVAPTQLQNDNLKWETTTQQNLGVDLAIFNNKVSLTADIYRKKTSDMLIVLPLPITSGFDQIRQNIGEMTNEGLELSLNLNPISSLNFSWNLNANYSSNINEVTNLDGITIFGGDVVDQGNVTIIREGEPLGNFFGHVADGIDPDTGDVIFADLDGNGIINDDDRTIIGNALPDFSWGVTNTLKYKGFDLIVFFQGVEGQDIYNASRFELENQSSFNNQSTTVLNRWAPNNRETDIPRAVFGDPNQNGRASTRWVEDGSFIKLRELTVGYTVPKRWIEKLRIDNLRLYVQGRNLYTWTDYSGYDPEVSRDGGDPLSLNIDYGTYPQVRTYIAGMNLSF